MKSAGLSNVSKDTRFWKTLDWLVNLGIAQGCMYKTKAAWRVFPRDATYGGGGGDDRRRRSRGRGVPLGSDAFLCARN